VVRYSFPVRLFHPHLYAGLSRRTKLKLIPQGIQHLPETEALRSQRDSGIIP